MQRGGDQFSSQAGTCQVPFGNDPPGVNGRNQPAKAGSLIFSRTLENHGLDKMCIGSTELRALKTNMGATQCTHKALTMLR